MPLTLSVTHVCDASDPRVQARVTDSADTHDF